MNRSQFHSDKILHFAYALIAFFFIQGCTSNQKIDQEAVREEMKSRELKRVTEVQVMEKGRELGEEISAVVQRQLQYNLSQAIAEGGISNALQYCNVNATSIVKDIEEKYAVRVYRVSQQYRNPNDEPDSLENLILGAYQYSFDNEQDISSSVQEEYEDTLLFTKPIMVGAELCLNCHGTVGENLSEENYDVITSLYPEDKAINYKLGDLRGMWSIRIPRKTIIESL